MNKLEIMNYLNSAIHDKEDFLYALFDVIQKEVGFSKVAVDSYLTREALYKALKPSKHPSITTIYKIINALGYELKLVELDITKEKDKIRKNSLLALFPDIASQIHPTKNKRLIIKDLNPNSRKRIWWLCEKNHIWEDYIIRRVNGKICHLCEAFNTLKEYNENISGN